MCDEECLKKANHFKRYEKRDWNEVHQSDEPNRRLLQHMD